MGEKGKRKRKGEGKGKLDNDYGVRSTEYDYDR